jgi:predicted dithiol-disulfide oxidoreductase (DUF899 family)
MRNQVVSREEWLKACLELLAAEKEVTRQRDALTRVEPAVSDNDQGVYAFGKHARVSCGTVGPPGLVSS